MEFYVMNRRGVFHAHISTPNQCVREGYGSKYLYTLRLVFNGDIALDKNSFIIDHITVDEVVKDTVLMGSCEDMHKTLLKAIRKCFKDRNIRLVGYKATIKGNGNPAAYMEYVHMNESVLSTAYFSIISSLLSK